MVLRLPATVVVVRKAGCEPSWQQVDSQWWPGNTAKKPLKIWWIWWSLSTHFRTHYTFGGVAGKALDIVEVPDDLEECAVSDLVKILCKLIVYPCIFDTIELLHCKQGLAWQASCMARSEFVMIAQYTDKVIRYVGAVGQTTIF